MSLNRHADDWFLGKTRAVYGKKDDLVLGKASKRGGKTSDGRKGGKSARHAPPPPLKSGSALTNLKAAALKHPEVMVKIPKRLSNKSNGMRGIRNHLDYVSRNGEVSLETSDGERLEGKKAVRSLLDDWQKLGIPEEGKHKEAVNIVLSMPAGTPPQAVLNAARTFAAEQFGNHQYAFCLHHESEKPGEPAHPHVHLCVLIRDGFGQRLNPRKNDLFEWRVRFAEKLRDEGVLCAATKRQHRGRVQKPEDGIQRAMRQRGALSRTARQQAKELMSALKSSQRPTHPFLKETMQTRGIILEQYGKIAKELYKMGHKTEARIVSKLAKETAAQPFDTQAQQSYDRLHGNRRAISRMQQRLDENKPQTDISR